MRRSVMDREIDEKERLALDYGSELLGVRSATGMRRLFLGAHFSLFGQVIQALWREHSSKLQRVS